MENTVAIYGLDEEYMRRLALYVNDRSEGRFCLIIVDENDFESCPLRVWVVPSSMRETVLGSRDVDNDFSKGDAGNNLTKDDACSDRDREYIFLAEDYPGKDEIFMFSNCDALYRAIKRRVSLLENMEERKRYLTDKRWYCFVSDERTYSMIRFWNVLSAVIAADKRVLVLHMCLLGKGAPDFLTKEGCLDVDMGDLILELRKGQKVPIEGYAARRFAKEFVTDLPEKYDEMFVDYIPEFYEPTYLVNLKREDVERLIDAVDAGQGYDCILVMMTDMFESCENFLTRADKIILCGDGDNELCTVGFWTTVIHNLSEQFKTIVAESGKRPSGFLKNAEKLWADLRLEERGLRCGER